MLVMISDRIGFDPIGPTKVQKEQQQFMCGISY